MKKILIKTKGKTFILKSDEIRYCKAAGSYSVIFLDSQEEIVTSINLLNLHHRMKDFDNILRVSQSILVNLTYIKCILYSTKEIELHGSTFLRYTIASKELEKELVNTMSKLSLK